jgi:hypothetical protein
MVRSFVPTILRLETSIAPRKDCDFLARPLLYRACHRFPALGLFKPWHPSPRVAKHLGRPGCAATSLAPSPSRSHREFSADQSPSRAVAVTTAVLRGSDRDFGSELSAVIMIHHGGHRVGYDAGMLTRALLSGSRSRHQDSRRVIAVVLVTGVIRAPRF